MRYMMRNINTNEPYYSAQGNFNMNVAPLSTSLSISIVPP